MSKAVLWVGLSFSFFWLCWCHPVHAESTPEIIYQTIAMESASEPGGMKYVALTLVNRARVRGTTLETEALRPKQYSCWNGGGKWAKAWLGKHYTSQVRYQANKALAMALNDNRFPKLINYHTKNIKPYWAKTMKFEFMIGSHMFYSSNG